MSLLGHRVTVGTAATELSITRVVDSLPGQTVILQNRSGVPIFLGDSEVTSTHYGYVLDNNKEVGIELAHLEQWFACVASGTAIINVTVVGDK